MLSRIAYLHDPAGCLLLGFGFGWGLAFLGVEFLSSVAIAEGTMGCTALGKAAESWPQLACVFSRTAHPQESGVLLSLGTCVQLGETFTMWKLHFERSL